MSSLGNPNRTALVWCSNGHPAGGMERIAISIANGLIACGWRVVLAGPFRDAPVLRQSIRPEVEFINHDASRSQIGIYRTMRFLQQLVRKRSVDVISAHGLVFPLIFTRTPVVWTEHDIRYGGSMLHGLRGLAWRWIRFRLQHGNWRVITVSRHVHSLLCQYLKIPKHMGLVIYNGLPNADALRALPPPKMTEPYQIGFLGRIDPIKRPFDVFELSTALNSRGIRHDWNVFGDGDLMPEMRERAQKPGHSVRICGLAERPDHAIARMDLLCFHSRGEQEGLGMVLLEAMAANRRVVAWDVGCIGEVLGDRGTLVPPPFSLERYADAIVEELREGNRRTQKEDGRWDESRMIRDYHAVLTDAILGRKLQSGSV